MKKILLLVLLLTLPMSNLTANEDGKYYTPVINLYEKAKSKTTSLYNKLISESNLILGFQSLDQPLTKGFDFVCYNSCKERNEESFCKAQCSLK